MHRLTQALILWCFQAKDILALKIPTWQEKCSDITNVPDSVVSMIEGLSVIPEQSPLVDHYNRVRFFFVNLLCKCDARNSSVMHCFV